MAYFRFVMTILAAFAAFFAYTCRLNLSLTAVRMVANQTDALNCNNSTVVIHFDNKIVNCTLLDEAVKKFELFRTEDYAWAWLSRRSSLSRRNSRSIDNGSSGSGDSQIRSARIVSAPNSELLSTDYTRQSLIEAANSSVSLSSVNIDLDPSGNASSDESVIVENLKEPHLLYWTHLEKNRMLAAFFYGYVISQIPGARAAEIFGAKSIFLVTGLGSGLCSLVFPIAAKTNYWLAYAVRVIMGISQGATFPAIYVFLCQWLPDNERSPWLPVPSAFSRIGAIIMNFVIPFILDHYDWEMVFYFFGTATLVWSIIFIVFGSNSPQQSFWVSKKELIYIESHMIGSQTRAQSQNKQKNIALTASGFTINEDVNAVDKRGLGSSKPSINWLKVIKNKAILLLSLVMFASEWSNYILLINLPGFLGTHGPFEMEASEIGLWSSILIAIFCVQFPLSGVCATQLEARTSLGSLNVRKIFEAAAQILQGVGCLVIAFYGDVVITLTALVIMMLGRSTVGGGQCLMPPELSKDYPGTVFASANTLANVAGVIGPEIFTLIVEKPRDHACWFWFWILSASIFFGAGAIFCLLGENEPQNYCGKQPKSAADNSLSFAQLTVGKKQADEIFKLDTFSRVSSEPSRSNITGHSPSDLLRNVFEFKGSALRERHADLILRNNPLHPEPAAWKEADSNRAMALTRLTIDLLAGQRN